MPRVIWSLYFIFMIAREVVAFEEACAINWKRFGNSCYLFVKETKDWKNARSHCLRRGADLVSLTTVPEIQFVYAHTININKNIWIGLNKINRTKMSSDRAWVWSNGERPTIVKWFRKEPNNFKDEHCVEIKGRTIFWRNQNCDKRRAWICEKSKRVTKWTTYTKIIQKTKAFPNIATTKETTTKDIDQTTNRSDPSVFSVRMALYIFLPMILLALIVVIIVIARMKKLNSSEKKSSRQDNGDEEIAEKGLNRQTDSNFTIIDDGYTQLHQNREPENAYTSLNLYETPDADYNGPYVVSNDRRNNQINEPNISTPQAIGSQQRSSYVIPALDYIYDLPYNN